MNSHHICDILHDEYGVGPLHAEPCVIMWAADLIDDVSEAKAGIKYVNALREKWGRVPVYVPYGHRLF